MTETVRFEATKNFGLTNIDLDDTFFYVDDKLVAQRRSKSSPAIFEIESEVGFHTVRVEARWNSNTSLVNLGLFRVKIFQGNIQIGSASQNCGSCGTGSGSFTTLPVSGTKIQAQAQKDTLIEPDFKEHDISGHVTVTNETDNIIEYQTNVGLSGIVTPNSEVREEFQNNSDLKKVIVSLFFEGMKIKEKSFNVSETITDHSERGKFDGIKSYITLSGSSATLTNRLFFTIDNSKSDFESTNTAFMKFINSKSETFVTPPRTINKYYLEITDIDELLTIQSIAGSYRVSDTDVGGSFREDDNLKQQTPPELGANPLESNQDSDPSTDPQPEPTPDEPQEGLSDGEKALIGGGIAAAVGTGLAVFLSKRKK